MKLLWASFGLGIPSAIQGYLDTPALWFVVVTLLVTTFAVFLYFKLASGRNWARIVLTALVVLGSVALAAPAEPRLLVLQVLDYSCLALEFGAVWEHGELRTYGAGLLSSFGEIQACPNDGVRIGIRDPGFGNLARDDLRLVDGLANRRRWPHNALIARDLCRTIEFQQVSVL